MGYDSILSKVGDFGLYQKLLCGVFVFYTTFICGLNYYTQVFIFNTPAHRCSDSLLDSYPSPWDDLLPWMPRDQDKPNQCKMVDIPKDSRKLQNLSSTYFYSLQNQAVDPDLFLRTRRDVITLVANSPQKSCDNGWRYDFSSVFETITSENDWVCEEDYKPMLIQTVFWIGNIVGCFIWGFTNDYFGRKPTVLMTHALYFLAGAATLSAPNFSALVICRMIPESPSWLLVKGRTDEALEQLAKVARWNGKEFQLEAARKDLEKEREAETSSETSEKVSLVQMFRTPTLRVNALLCTCVCFAGFLCYYGIVQNTSNMGEGSLYMSYFLGALSEIPCWSVPFIIAKLGRRWTLLTFFIAAGVCSLAYAFIPTTLALTSLVVALTGRMSIYAAFFICLQYAGEIFPTVVRGKGIALCEVVGGTAIFLSPTIIYLGQVVAPVLPTIIFGFVSLLGAVATFFLPETAGKALPQTLKDGQDFGVDQTWWDCFCNKKKLDDGFHEIDLKNEVMEKLILPRITSHTSMAHVLV